ncbi:hypothetical protein RJ640_024947 [Escallonia rubra]|uniref:Uncharacterized protein n=1 Tax=Escallonia rubra TaxID=112253 RepID=A0AA88UNV4_9ASTE|nr:hypothetical protein RJ640_024947 [Escallonia rubra]
MEIIYSINNASHGNVIGPLPGSPNSSSDIFKSCLKTSLFRYTKVAKVLRFLTLSLSHTSLFQQDRMINTKKLARMVRKWQSFVAIRRKRISLPRNIKNVEESCSGTQLLADKGHFVVYSDDGRRFVIPLVYLNNEVLRQLLTISEEVFGLPGDGPITLPCDALLVEYIISLIQRRVSEHLEKALLTSVCGSRCTSSLSLHQGQSSQQLFYTSNCWLVCLWCKDAEDVQRLLQTDISKAFSTPSATPSRIKKIIYSIKDVSQGNVTGLSPGSPNSSSDIFKSCLKTSLFRYTKGITNRLPSSE